MRERMAWVDQFRGLLIAHMALDHASLMMNAGRWGEELAARQPPPPQDLAQFLARFTGVAVAPGFAFMAGFMVAATSVSREGRGVSSSEITRRLVIRGLVLILADATVGGLPRALSGFYSFMVLSSIGASLIALAFLRSVPRPALAALALAILTLHPLLDVSGLPLPLRAVLYEPVREGPFRSLYPIIPWIGVVIGGFVVGAHACARERAPRRLWLGLSAASLALFFAVRLHGGFGNAYPHHGLGALDFWFFAKYPPDLAWLSWSSAQIFLAMAALSWLSRESAPAALAPFAQLGRVSFFFYLTHFYVLGALTAVVGGRRGLAESVALWGVGLAVMLPLCRWYEKKKRERPNVVTRYL